MNAVLVTGVAGYIGSHVARLLLSAGEPVVGLDDLSRGERALVPRGAQFVHADTGDTELLTSLMNEHEVSVVMHLAAYVDVEESVKNPELYYENNARKSERLFACAVRRSIPVIFSSSAAVYGNPDAIPVPEDTPAVPVNPYGKSKLMAEEALAAISIEAGVRTIALRYFNVAGGGYSLKQEPTHLIRTAVRAALGLAPSLKIFGTDYPTKDGTCVRDYIYVGDIARAHLDALAHLRRGGSSLVCNVGYGHGYSVREVVEAVKRVSGRDFKVEEAPRRPGDPAALVADATRAREVLEWRPRFDDFETIIGSELEWVRSGGTSAPSQQ